VEKITFDEPHFVGCPMTASKPWKARARAPSTDVSVWSLGTPEGSSIINRSSVIFVPMIGATYIWNSFLARFSLERDRQRVAALVMSAG
jgi:hypothetical protein